MSIDDAIKKMEGVVLSASGSAQIKVVKMSDEEARMTVMVPGGDVQAVKDAAFKPALDLLNSDGFDIQVQVYDKDKPLSA